MRSKVVGLSRVRNESAILSDTLDHFGQWCDEIIVYDDCSTDNTVEIAMAHPKVGTLGVIEQFEPWSTDRTREEWRHRQILLDAGRVRKPEWFIYFDADERLVWDGGSPDDAFNDAATDALYTELYDAYLTPGDHDPFRGGRMLWGPEYRDIVFAFRNLPRMRYCHPDQRIVQGYALERLAGRCKHYGKAISIEEWESTCDYYIRWFPEPYKSKWRARKGKAIHTESDFGKPLYTWEEAQANKVCIGGLPW